MKEVDEEIVFWSYTVDEQGGTVSGSACAASWTGRLVRPNSYGTCLFFFLHWQQAPPSLLISSRFASSSAVCRRCLLLGGIAFIRPVSRSSSLSTLTCLGAAKTRLFISEDGSDSPATEQLVAWEPAADRGTNPESKCAGMSNWLG